MTSAWLLVAAAVLCSQCVHQTTAVNGTCRDKGLIGQLQRDLQTIMQNQQTILAKLDAQQCPQSVESDGKYNV